MPKSSRLEARAPTGFGLARRLLAWLGPAAGQVRSIQSWRLGGYLHEMCRPWFERLGRSRGAMEPESARTERQFLAFGEGLGQLSANCDGLVERGNRLMELSTGGGDEGDDAVSAVRELLEYPLSFIEAFAFDTAGLAASAERTAAAVERMLKAESELFGALRPLTFLRTLFHIESARLTNEVFGSMDGEIEAMQEVIETQFRAKFGELRDLRQALVGFTAEYAERTRVLSVRVTEKRATLNHSFKAMKQGVAASCHLQHGIRDTTGGLSADVNRMVVSLQSHDIVMQRLGHIQRGLAVLEGMYAGMTDCDLGAARRTVATLAAVARLEAAQVRATRGQVGEASQTLRENVGDVLKAIRDFDQDCLLGEFGQATAGVSGTIQVLLEAIEDTVALMSEAAEAAHACSQPLEPLGALVASLSEDIAQTGEHMHRLALNVQLAAVQHGAGTGLEVLAERMAHIAGEVSHICQTVDTAIGELTGGLRHTLEGFAETTAESVRMAELFSGHESESLHELRDATLKAFGEVSEIVAETHQTAAGMKAVDLGRMCDQILPEMEAALEEIANGAAGLAAMLRAEDLSADELRVLRTQYTMHAERAVHDASVGKAATQDRELVTAGGAAGLGDNVELF